MLLRWIAAGDGDGDADADRSETNTEREREIATATETETETESKHAPHTIEENSGREFVFVHEIRFPWGKYCHKRLKHTRLFKEFSTHVHMHIDHDKSNFMRT